MKFLPDNFQDHMKFANGNITFLVTAAFPAGITYIFAPEWKISAWIVCILLIFPAYLFFYLLSFYFACAKNNFNSNFIRPISVERKMDGQYMIISNSINFIGRYNKVDLFYKSSIAEVPIAHGIIESITSEGFFQIVIFEGSINNSYQDKINLLLENDSSVMQKISIKPAAGEWESPNV